ncbi:MAG: type IV pilus biogenesis/stability protein PilW [Pseudomonadales bacterium]|nr:type IV pilus biogenesis/stability protein PilW [Pseudomonadales bacterium]
MRVILFLLVCGLLSGCVTETKGPLQAADRDKQLKSLVDLGIGYMREGEYARAKESLNKALDLEPKSPEAHDALALVFQLEQEYDDAETHFKAALKANPSYTRARNNYGAFLYDRKRYDDAIAQLKIAGEDRFYNARSTVFENLGVIYQQVGDNKAAEESFQRSIALNPDQARALLELADIRYGQQRYVESRELYRRYGKVAQPNAKSLWLCIRISRVFSSSNEEASCALALKNIFPASPEYKSYQDLVGK